MTLDAAEAAWTSGAPARALELAEGLLEEDLDRELRARALQVAGRVEFQIGVAERALERLLAALELCEEDEQDRAATIVYFACLALWVQGRIDEQIALAERGVALAAGGTPTGSATAHYMLGQALTMGGRSAEAERALLWPMPPSSVSTGMERPLEERRGAFCLFMVGRLAEAAELAEGALSLARSRGPMQTVWALTTLARVLLRTGRWDRAEGLATEGAELAGAVDQVAARAEMELILARIAGARGDTATCAALLERSTAHAARSGNVFGANEARWALGRAALGGDRLDDPSPSSVAAAGRPRRTCSRSSLPPSLT